MRVTNERRTKSDIDDKSYIYYFTDSTAVGAFHHSAAYDHTVFKTKKDQRQAGNVCIYLRTVSDLRIFYDHASVAVRRIFRRDTSAERASTADSV